MRIAAYKEKEEKCGPGTTVDVALLTPNRDGYVIPRFDNSPAILCTPSPRVTRNVLEGLIPFDTPAKPVYVTLTFILIVRFVSSYLTCVALLQSPPS